MAPQSVRYVSWGLSLAGLAIAAWLTIAHYSSTSLLACSSTGTVDCAAVTTSAQSMILGIPVAVLGLIQFSIMSVVTSPWGWRREAIGRVRLEWLRLGLAGVGMAFVLWLVAAELLIIGHICLWCTGVHVVSFALLVTLLVGWGRSQVVEYE